MSVGGHGAATETGAGREICRTEVGIGKETEVENTPVGSFPHLTFLVPSNAQILPPTPLRPLLALSSPKHHFEKDVVGW